jgi:hypothetical protein
VEAIALNNKGVAALTFRCALHGFFKIVSHRPHWLICRQIAGYVAVSNVVLKKSEAKVKAAQTAEIDGSGTR